MSEVRYTADQLRAMEVQRTPLDTCVVAGPGSGKTTVLVEYFGKLVAADVDPLRILAITFTEKAASNMRKKLAESFAGRKEIRAKLERAWVSTVHGFCGRLLRENAVFAGIDPEFYVADERESWRLQQESMADAMEQLFAESPAAVRALIRGLSSIEFEQAVLSAYDAMRGAGVRVSELAEFPEPAATSLEEFAETVHALRRDPVSNWSYQQKQHRSDILESAARIVGAPAPLEALRELEEFPANLQKSKRGTVAYELVRRLKEQAKDLRYTLITAHFAPERRLLLGIIERFDAVYRERKRQAGALDFSDLEEFAVRLLEEHPETRARLQQQFDHILMDEFQDTNGQQARLLQLVRPADRFYAVGDINQSIFGFRHAEPAGFSEYRAAIEGTGGRLVELVANFRSRAEILSAVETVVEGEPGIERRGLVAGREFSQPRPVAVELIGVTATDMAAAGRLEAQWVARRILDLAGDATGDAAEFAFEDVAVLVRNTEVIADLTEAFDQAGIPYQVNRGRGFYETREVNDLMHLLRIIANPRDEVSLAVALRSPLVGASDEALLALRVMGQNIGAALMQLTPAEAAQFAPEDFARLTRFRDRLREWRLRRDSVSSDRLLLAAIDDCGYRAVSGARGMANIDKFLAQVRAAAGRSLDDIVEELALVRESNPREADAPPEDSANAVQVMTVHSAKGLEFPVVFVAALHKGIESNPPVVAFSPRIGLGARWRNPVVREDKDDVFQHAIRDERARREAEESSRLLYVAMTRAEQHLVLSFATNGKRLGNWAEVVTRNLGVEMEPLREETVACTAPDGKEWRLRVLTTNAAPEIVPRPVPEQSAENVAWLPAPAMTEQQDTNATVTALTRFAHCPRSYYLKHYLGFEGRQRDLDSPGETDGLAAAEFGTQVHQLLAGKPVPQPDPEAVRVAETFRTSALGRRAAQATRMEREFAFLMAVDGLVIRGDVDLWFEEAGEVVIVDYKTDKVTAHEAHRRAQDYALQLRLYALAVEQAAGRAPDRAWLHFLRPNTVVEVDLTPSLLDSPEQAVREFQEAQAELRFALHEGEHCKRCPFYKDLCPAGK
jgi:ATP-dependent helicase/nuclease subunit A